MKRFAVFAILGPCLAGMTMLLLVLRVATWLGGKGGSIPVGRPGFDRVPRQHLPVPGGRPFDWIAEIIDVPHRPFGAAVVGGILAVVALRGFLAMPDLPGWFVAIGLIGGIRL
jgi:hypothetical protein